MIDLNNPVPQEWLSYVTQSPVGLEIVPHHLYDTLSYTSATTVQLDFFQQTNVAKSISDIQQPGMLPNPQSFLIQTIGIYFRTIPNLAATAAAGETNDMVLLVNTGIMLITIGTKTYGPFPLWKLPPGSFVQGYVTGTFTAPLYYNYGQ